MSDDFQLTQLVPGEADEAQQMDEQPDEAAEAPEPAAAAAAEATPAVAVSSSSLADLMNEGEDDTMEEQAAAAAAEAEAEAEPAAEAAAAEEAGDAEEEGGAADGGDADSSSAPADLEALLAGHCRTILASLSLSDVQNFGKTQILKRLKEIAGKKLIKANKELATRVAREVATERLAELEGAAGEGEQAAGEEAAAAEEEAVDTREPIGDEEDEDEEPKKKSRKRLRKKEEDSDAEEQDADEDYSEERTSKKKKAKKASSSKSKSASSSSAAAAAASSSSATAALLAFPTPKTPFQIFQSSERRTMKDANPDATHSELSKLINDKWNALDDDAKAEFEQLARKQKTDHAADLARLKEEDPEAYSKHIKAVKKREEESLSGPGGKKKKRAEYDDDPADGHDPDNPPAELSYFDSIVHDLKSKKQTKSVLNDEEQKDMETAFMDKMMNAAKRDEEAAAAGKPAVHKLKMLPDVQAQLSKSKVADRMLDNGLLRCLCAWIAPEADGSLPNVRLRTVVYQLLETLNVNETNLANSQGLGKRVMRLWKEPEETLPNKRILEALMEKWMRPMLGLSTDYRKSSEHEEERAQEIFRRKAIIDAQPKPLNYNPKRARIPEPARFDYAIRPQATEDHEAAEEEAREVAKKQPAESRKQMLTKKLDKMSRAGSNIAKPRFKVDITGRASNL